MFPIALAVVLHGIEAITLSLLTTIPEYKYDLRAALTIYMTLKQLFVSLLLWFEDTDKENTKMPARLKKKLELIRVFEKIYSTFAGSVQILLLMLSIQNKTILHAGILQSHCMMFLFVILILVVR